MVGRGFRPSRGDGRLIIMVAGHIPVIVGAGFPAPAELPLRLDLIRGLRRGSHFSDGATIVLITTAIVTVIVMVATIKSDGFRWLLANIIAATTAAIRL